MLNQASGLRCPIPEGAFYVYPSLEGLVGKTAPSGKRIETDEDFVVELWKPRAARRCTGRRSASRPSCAFPYATSNDVLEDACQRIQRFCASLK